MEITVLRLGHRPERDKRVTTHCALVARAFGAKELVYSGTRDKKFEQSVQGVVENWGGPFEVKYERSWKKLIRSFPGTTAHLTMYGKPYPQALKRAKSPLLVVIGGEKVPGEVYGMVDMNVAVGNQPHSEIAALAVFLNGLNGIKTGFAGARLRITPSAKGKRVTSA